MSGLHVLLIGLLLAWVQLGGTAHALEHLEEGTDDHAPACEWCLVHANLQHAAAASPPALPVPAAGPAPVVCGRPRCHAAFIVHYFSRAPPRPLV